MNSFLVNCFIFDFVFVLFLKFWGMGVGERFFNIFSVLKNFSMNEKGLGDFF